MSLSNTVASVVVGVLIGSVVKVFTGPVITVPSFSSAEVVETNVLRVEADDGMSVIEGISERDFTRVLAAIRYVESNNDPNVKDGDGGKAIGVYQIWEDYWKDAAEYGNMPGTYQDCRKPKYADKTVRNFMARYCTSKRLGRKPMLRDISFMHVGGPKAPWATGKKLENCETHWAKVQKVLKIIR
jgi:hypothetical protein